MGTGVSRLGCQGAFQGAFCSTSTPPPPTASALAPRPPLAGRWPPSGPVRRAVATARTTDRTIAGVSETTARAASGAAGARARPRIAPRAPTAPMAVTGHQRRLRRGHPLMLELLLRVISRWMRARWQGERKKTPAVLTPLNSCSLMSDGAVVSGAPKRPRSTCSAPAHDPVGGYRKETRPQSLQCK
jgi:hypothetical protein